MPCSARVCWPCLAGSKRDANFVYRLFQVVTSPVIKLMRLVTPRFVIDRHLPFLAFFLLFWLWLALAFPQALPLHPARACMLKTA